MSTIIHMYVYIYTYIYITFCNDQRKQASYFADKDKEDKASFILF